MSFFELLMDLDQLIIQRLLILMKSIFLNHRCTDIFYTQYCAFKVNTFDIFIAVTNICKVLSI